MMPTRQDSMEVVGRNGTGRVLLRIWWVTPVRVQIPSLAPSFSGLFTTGTIRQWCKFGANEIKGQLDGLSFLIRGFFTKRKSEEWCKFGANKTKSLLDGLSFLTFLLHLLTIEHSLDDLCCLLLHRRKHMSVYLQGSATLSMT
jgi:hypothetical protein